MRNWGHRTLRVGVSRLWVSGYSVACRPAWRSLCGASPSGQATAVQRAPRSGPCLEACPCDPVPPTASIPAAYFGLTRGFCTFRSLSSACRRRVAPLLLQFPPRLVVVWSRLEVVWRPTCRPPRRKTPTMGSRGRGRLRWQHNDAWPRAPLAHSPLRCEREPAIACANRLYRT